MTSTQLVPVIVVPFVAWRIYSRVRRNIGRQKLRRSRLVVAVTFFSILTALIAVVSFPFTSSIAALGGGLVVGVPLALVSLRLTRFEESPEGEFYTPHTGIGLGMAMLLIARVAYRMIVLFGRDQNAPAAPPLFQSPLTLLIFGVTAGYYIAYYSGLLIRSRKSAAVDAGS